MITSFYGSPDLRSNMKTPTSLCLLRKSQLASITLMIGIMAATILPTGIRDAFGYFTYVLICSACLFICLEMYVISICSDLMDIGILISTSSSSETDKVKEEKEKLGQETAKDCTRRLAAMWLLKVVMNVLFMCQFYCSYELAERKYLDEGKIFDSDARLSSSHVIAVTKFLFAIALSVERLIELNIFVQIYLWADDEKNFKLKRGRSGRSSRSGKKMT